jgi:hypothetical protein
MTESSSEYLIQSLELRYLVFPGIPYETQPEHFILLVTSEVGRAIAQAVSRWLPTAVARVPTRV